eukprot:PhM_4_TR14127/c1_g1_i1/m.90882
MRRCTALLALLGCLRNRRRWWNTQDLGRDVRGAKQTRRVQHGPALDFLSFAARDPLTDCLRLPPPRRLRVVAVDGAEQNAVRDAVVERGVVEQLALDGAGHVHEAAELTVHVAEGLVRSVHVDSHDKAEDVGGDAVQTQRDLLVVTVAITSEVVTSVDDTQTGTLCIAEVHKFLHGGVAPQHHDARVEVATRVPAETYAQVVDVLWDHKVVVLAQVEAALRDAAARKVGAHVVQHGTVPVHERVPGQRNATRGDVPVRGVAALHNVEQQRRLCRRVVGVVLVHDAVLRQVRQARRDGAAVRERALVVAVDGDHEAHDLRRQRREVHGDALVVLGAALAAVQRVAAVHDGLVQAHEVVEVGHVEDVSVRVVGCACGVDVDGGPAVALAQPSESETDAVLVGERSNGSEGHFRMSFWLLMFFKCQ